MDRPDFRYRHPVDVRFKDIDIGGHAHHSHALVYFEEARAAYLREVAGRTTEVDYILAEASIRWHRRVLWPARLDVGVRVSRLGRTHFEMEYEALSAAGETMISGSTLQVMYDYGRAAKTRLPAELRDAIEAWDGPFADKMRTGKVPPV